MLSQKLLEILYPILTVVATGVAGIIGAYFTVAIKKINGEVNSIKNADDRALADKILTSAEDSIRTAVGFTNQTLVDTLKAKSADGKLTPEEITQSFKTAYDKAVELMGSDLLNQLQNLKPDFQSWITTKIEFYVSQVK